MIRRYLAAARAIKGILILDIQPGQADFMEEVRALEPYPRAARRRSRARSGVERSGGRRAGQQIGSTDAATVNEVSSYLSLLVQRSELPQKLLIVHQFTEEMVTDRRRIVPRPGRRDRDERRRLRHTGAEEGRVRPL